ncbi:hypothetical protein BDN72DRAFT_963455 [Pluteus cervinus]|uniref:Uncharacterized protein n=1 Tax=Pluteus cervinus TaxID=181527 RepID=A0ACD3ADX3_9AGAR|nr:hypothetical protein BDN72DRAFT_963455 [Pluteus cervinus]
MNHMVRTLSHLQVGPQSPTHQETSLILTLPVELLARIFLFCVPMSFEKLSSDLWWIGLSHVCQRWRHIALTTPGLWASIVFSRPKWTSEMLTRARQAPLILRANLEQQSSEKVVPIITHNISRLRILELTASRSTLTELLKDLEAEAPALESLSIATGQTYVPIAGFQIPDTILPPGSRNIMLWHLKLSGCAFAWDSPRYLQLTKLELHRISERQRLSLPEFLRFLPLIPRLSDLVLVDSLPSAAEGALVNLPHLTTLVVEDQKDRLLCFLSHITFPDTVLPQLSLRMPPEWPTHYNFYQTLRKSYPKRIKHRNLTFSLTCLDEKLSFSLIKESGRPIVSFSISGKLVRSRFSWSFAKLVTIFSSCHIKTLILGASTTVIPTIFDSQLWNQALLSAEMSYWEPLNALEGVETLYILDHPPVMFLECLLERAMNCIGVCIRWSTTHVGSDGRGRQLLPELKHLGLSGVNFSRPVDTNCPTVYEVIISYLWARKRFGSPLTSAHLGPSCTNIYREDLALLEYMMDVTISLDSDYLKETLPTARLPLDFENDPQATAISVFTELRTLLILHDRTYL